MQHWGVCPPSPWPSTGAQSRPLRGLPEQHGHPRPGGGCCPAPIHQGGWGHLVGGCGEQTEPCCGAAPFSKGLPVFSISGEVWVAPARPPGVTMMGGDRLAWCMCPVCRDRLWVPQEASLARWVNPVSTVLGVHCTDVPAVAPEGQWLIQGHPG